MSARRRGRPRRTPDARVTLRVLRFCTRARALAHGLLHGAPLGLFDREVRGEREEHRGRGGEQERNAPPERGPDGARHDLAERDARAGGDGEDRRDVRSLVRGEQVAAHTEKQGQTATHGDAGERARREELPVRLDPERAEARRFADGDDDREQTHARGFVREPPDDERRGRADDEERELQVPAQVQVLLAVVETELLRHRREVGREQILIRVQERARHGQQRHRVPSTTRKRRLRLDSARRIDEACLEVVGSARVAVRGAGSGRLDVAQQAHLRRGTRVRHGGSHLHEPPFPRSDPARAAQWRAQCRPRPRRREATRVDRVEARDDAGARV